MKSQDGRFADGTWNVPATVTTNADGTWNVPATSTTNGDAHGMSAYCFATDGGRHMECACYDRSRGLDCRGRYRASFGQGSPCDGVEPQLVKNRGMNVGDIMAIFDGMKTDLVSRPMDHSAANSASGHPYRESKNMMIPSIGSLRTRRASEFRSKDDERFFEHPTTPRSCNNAPMAGQRPGHWMRDSP